MDIDTSIPRFGQYSASRAVQMLIGLAQITPMGRGKMRKYIARQIRKGHDGPLDASLFDLNARLYLHDNSSELKALLKPNIYGRDTKRLCAQMLSAPGSVAVDIGANSGMFSLLMASCMTTGRLIAIEPLPDVYERLRTNLIEMNPALEVRIAFELFVCAVGRETCESPLTVPKQLGQSSLRTLPAGEAVTIPVRPLLDVLEDADAEQIDFLKIDVEGYEDEVLVPFFNEASTALWPRAIFLEHCHADRWEVDCEDLLRSRNYSQVRRSRTDVIYVRNETMP